MRRRCRGRRVGSTARRLVVGGNWAAGLPSSPPDDGGAFLESLTETSLYSIGAYFADRHPELVDDVIAEAQDIEHVGLARWAEREGATVEAAFQTLVTGLAVRYYKAVAGERRARLPDTSGRGAAW